MGKLTKKNEKIISDFFRDFILSFKTVFMENFDSKVMQTLEIKLKSVHFLKDIVGIEKGNYFVSKRLYSIKDGTVQMYALYPESLMAVLSDIATGGDGDVELEGKITELQINSCIDSFNECYSGINTFIFDHYKESLEETSVENIYQGTPAYKTIFDENDFVVIYSVKFSTNTVLNVPILFKYQEIETLLSKLGLLKIVKPFDKTLYKNIDLIASTKIPLTVMLGSTELPLINVLKFDSGSLIKLDKNEGDYVDIYAKNVKVAEGQIVAIGEHFGVKIVKLLQNNDSEEDDYE